MSRGSKAIAALVACLVVAPAPASADTFKVTTGADPAPGKCAKRDCSLREAVRAANRRKGRDTIVLRSGRTHTLTIPGTGEDVAKTGDLDVTGPTTIRASKTARATVDAQGVDRVFHMLAPAKLQRLRITGGAINEANQSGFGILAQESRFDIERSLVAGNVGLGNNSSAGGLRMGAGGSVVRTTFKSNEVGEGGGGATLVGAPDRPVRVWGSRFLENRSGTGGGLIVSGGSVVKSLIDGNTAYQCGGVQLNGATLDRSTVIDNETVPTPTSLTFGGGGACLGSGSEIRDSSVVDNFAADDGGGVDVFGGERIVRSRIAGNTTNGEGGGVNVIFSDGFTITRSTFSNNSASADGGGLRAGSARVIVNSSTFSGNEGVLGAGILADDQPTGANDSVVDLRWSTITNNNSGNGGGIAAIEGGSFLSEGTLIGSNFGSPSPDCSGPVVSGGHNLVGDATGCNAFSAASDITGVDPFVTPLGANGGPTETVKPSASSAAIDNGGEDCPSKDQRGKPRPRGDACDIGSVEVGGG